MSFPHNYYNKLKVQNLFFFVNTESDESKRNKYTGFYKG